MLDRLGIQMNRKQVVLFFNRFYSYIYQHSVCLLFKPQPPNKAKRQQVIGPAMQFLNRMWLYAGEVAFFCCLFFLTIVSRVESKTWLKKFPQRLCQVRRETWLVDSKEKAYVTPLLPEWILYSRNWREYSFWKIKVIKSGKRIGALSRVLELRVQRREGTVKDFGVWGSLNLVTQYFKFVDFVAGCRIYVKTYTFDITPNFIWIIYGNYLNREYSQLDIF